MSCILSMLMGLKTLAGIVCGMAVWYAINSGPSVDPSAEIKYPLKDSVKVEYANYISKTGTEVIIDNRTGSHLERKLAVNDVDYDKHFTITTDRYNLVKDDDFWLSRQIGVIGSLPMKFLFWDWDMGRGQDEERSRAVLAMMEYNKDIKDITVRVNHNRVWKDLGRLFTDDKVTERNGLIPRILMGIPTVLAGEFFAELSRTDYYNPMTQTVITYSNIEAVAAHEIGHHKDFQKFDRDWIYSLSRILPPVMLYQEWAASDIGRQMLSKQDSYQFQRYLLSAFFLYTLGVASKLYRLKSKYEK